EGMKGAVSRAEQIVASTPGAILARQFDNPANPEIHRRTTAEEIWTDTGGQVDIVVGGIGTGGTLTGVGQVLKQRKPDVHVIGIEPAESPLLTQGSSGPHKIQGIGANFVPSVLDRSVIDKILTVPSDTALDWARRAAQAEGLFVGISAGAALAGAAHVAVKEHAAGRTIVVIIPDGGDRYMSTPLYSSLMEE
ncbi:MAG: pyridoxal-phosphate dependent enzyme, partial [Propionibacteriaceae bacterium]|nr:pyridoxal-phosphate dependent enzyme [Propionibacteriaceae bacterium]